MKKSFLNFLIPIFICPLIFTACTEPVKVPKKLISDATAEQMDQYLQNRTANDIPDDDRLVFGYTFEEMEEYLIYLKDIADKKQLSLDSIQFVIAAYPPHPEKDNKIYRAIYLRPTFKNGNINSVNKAQVSAPGDGGATEEGEHENVTGQRTKLDMSGCCHSAEFIEQAQQ